MRLQGDRVDVMSRFTFNLVYDGPALDEHRMDVRTLAPALLAMGDLLERTNEIVNGEQAKVSVNVHASFREGSFGIDIETAQSLWQKVLDFTGNHEVVSVVGLMGFLGFTVKDGAKSLITVIKWIRGRAIQRIEPLTNGNVRFFIDNEHLEVEERVYRLLRDYKIRKALQGVISDPLEHDGIDSVSTIDKDAKKVMMHVTGSEARLFKAPDAEEETLASEDYTATLQVLTLAFQDGNKWRFTEGGGNTYYASILDKDFLARIGSNESFAREDIIKARVRRTQRITKDGLKAEFEILEVLEHRSAAPKVQMRMELDPPTEN